MPITGTILFIGFAVLFSTICFWAAWSFFFHKKDGVCEVFGEGNDGRLELLKSNVSFRFIGRTPGKPDAQRIPGYKDFKPIDKTYSISWLKPNIGLFNGIFAKGTNKMYIVRDKDGFMHPMSVEWDEKTKMLTLKPNYRETIDWLVTEFDEKDKIKEKQGTIEKYMPQIVLAVVFIFAFMSMYYNWQHESTMISRISSEAAAFDAKVKTANQMYDPAILQKAMQIVAQWQIERGTINWTSSTINANGIRVSGGVQS